MAKKADDSKVTIVFRGGPRDGQSMVIGAERIPERLRLAFPEWCGYYRVDETLEYEYQDIPWVPLPLW